MTASSAWYELPKPARRELYWAELREVVAIGTPVAFTLLARFLTDFTDLSILGHLGTEYLAACSFSLIWINLTTQ